jgi:hypothetical protein
MTTTKKRKVAKSNGSFTAYTDHDRLKKLTTESTILAEYRRLKLQPVTAGRLLLSPALVEVLQTMELEARDKPQDMPGHPVGQHGGGDA